VTLRTVINTKDKGNELVVNNQAEKIASAVLQIAIKDKAKKYDAALLPGSKCLTLGLETGGRMT